LADSALARAVFLMDEDGIATRLFLFRWGARHGLSPWSVAS
jgi:hypothetical protein